MRNKCTLLMAAVVVVFAASEVDPARSQTMQGGMNPGMTQKGMDQDMMGHGVMQCSRDDKGSGMMGHHGGGMMMRMMGSGMMGSATMRGETESGMGTLFGSRVTPVMNLSEGDVRAYLASQLERLSNKRLKIGDVKSDEGTITADIVTVDNSLVQRLTVNRHTGAIEYQN